MGVINRFLSYFGLQEEVEVQGRLADDPEERDLPVYPQEPREARRASGNKNNVVSLHAAKTMRMVLSEPRTYDEAQEIADHLKFRRSVVVNLQRVRREHAVRIVDFLSGTVYALNGRIAKLGPLIFLCTPDNVEVTGTIAELEETEEIDFPKLR
ncbi:MAG: cell division protein SepF [Paenibacillaceae bacterium ZCTH02-B3]|nr:MAG: cell division protein SepF [Paenibacillaceae bacterium ZCTH02-B3]